MEWWKLKEDMKNESIEIIIINDVPYIAYQ